MTKRFWSLIICLIFIWLFLYYQNNAIVLNNIELSYDNLPENLNDFRIVHLSDLHNKDFGKDQNRLVSKINELNPDIIVITGDIVDSRKYRPESALTLVDHIKETAPIYYVIGNHELKIAQNKDFEEEMKKRGVHILRNSKELIEVSSSYIQILGIDDPLGAIHEGERIRENINIAIGDGIGNYFTILLSHRPEFFSIYSDHNIDLTLSGHAHGGQVRLPIIGGVIAPNQGMFPKYTRGRYTYGNSVMVVSRGLGNSIIPQRLFNRPEIVVVKLSSPKIEN